MSDQKATLRYGHGMLPDLPQAQCESCGLWSYLAARSNGRAGLCFGCEFGEMGPDASPIGGDR